jgi:hypothetical protein
VATGRSSAVVADFCAGLRDLQSESGIAVAALAGQLGISRQHLHEVLAGRVKRPPAWDQITDPLATLMGRTRAATLHSITDGCTTTELARRAGISAPAAS